MGWFVASGSLRMIEVSVRLVVQRRTQVLVARLVVASRAMGMGGEPVTVQDIDAVYHKKIEATREELWEACNGIVSEHHVYLLRTIRENSRHIEKQIEELDQKIKKALSPYENALEHLQEIPGLSRKTVEDLIAEIGLDMDVFPSEQHLCSWVGV